MDYPSELPLAAIASHEEVLQFIERRRLFGRRIGYVDVHLLAAVEVIPGAFLWTYDKPLRRVAEDLAIAVQV